MVDNFIQSDLRGFVNLLGKFIFCVGFHFCILAKQCYDLYKGKAGEFHGNANSCTHAWEQLMCAES